MGGRRTVDEKYIERLTTLRDAVQTRTSVLRTTEVANMIASTRSAALNVSVALGSSWRPTAKTASVSSTETEFKSIRDREWSITVDMTHGDATPKCLGGPKLRPTQSITSFSAQDNK